MATRTRPGRLPGGVEAFDPEGGRQSTARRAALVAKVLFEGSVGLPAARCIHLTDNGFGRASSYASGAREVKAPGAPPPARTPAPV